MKPKEKKLYNRIMDFERGYFYQVLFRSSRIQKMFRNLAKKKWNE